jgi:hypothetical protein
MCYVQTGNPITKFNPKGFVYSANKGHLKEDLHGIFSKNTQAAKLEFSCFIFLVVGTG